MQPIQAETSDSDEGTPQGGVTLLVTGWVVMAVLAAGAMLSALH